MKVIIISILSVIHISIILLLALGLRDVAREPSKYNRIKGYDEYKKSIWYWKPGKDYGKKDPPDNCGLCNVWLGAALFMWLVLPYASFLGGAFIPDAIECFSSLLGLANLVFSFAFVCIAMHFSALFSKRPMCICFSLFHIFPKKQRYIAWKNTLLILLVSCVIYFPIRTIGIFNYGYVCDDRIVYSPAFSLEENVFNFDDVTVNIVPNEDGQEIEHYYICNSSGEQLDIEKLCISSSTYEYIVNSLTAE